MAMVTVEFTFSDGSSTCEDFEGDHGVLSSIDNFIEDALTDLNADSNDDIECYGWEVIGSDCSDYMEQKDWDYFDNLDEWGEYSARVDEWGEAYVLRNDDWDGYINLDDYKGCFKSEEEFVRNLYESCYDIPDHLQDYIDWDSVVRDVMMDYSSYEGSEGYHIFRD